MGDTARYKDASLPVETRVDDLLGRMSLEEKIGQMQQGNGAAEENRDALRKGALGSILNLTQRDEPNPAAVANAFQSVAVTESRLGIPLILGRDVIHGFRTVFPINLGQAASFHPDAVCEASAIAAREASACGINWTFAPMVDIARDPRWGRIAEGGGEDTLLTSRMGAAAVRGFQGDDLSDPERIAACAKHYVGYGAAEGGRDYNTTYIPEGLLRDVYLPPFKACVDAGTATLMSAFNELNDVPTSGNEFTLRRVLKGEWGFDGFVVSDWGSVTEMIQHGYCADEKACAEAGVRAGVDMEMVTTAFVDNVAALLEEGKLFQELIDDAVRHILRIKFRLGLFENPYVDEGRISVLACDEHCEAARRVARECCVLLKNNGVLPLGDGVKRLAVIGPLADSPTDQMGTWVPDGVPEDVVTPLRALQDALAGRCEVVHAPGVRDCRSTDEDLIGDARHVASGADAVVLVLGEDAILSGEAHCRAFIDLPGAQAKLASEVAALRKPVAAVVMAGRALVLTDVVDSVGALLLAWHPGTMGGPAIADLLLGAESPCGKLPVSFPQAVGQVPVYYNHKNTGRPPAPRQRGVPVGTPLDPEGFTSKYLDVDPTPLFPFGFGLGYTTFDYTDLRLSSTQLALGESLEATVTITNTGDREGTEVVQLYTRDLVGSRTRPVKELKDFTRVTLQAGESREVSFALHTDQLAFHGPDMKLATEPGAFHLWVGGSSETGRPAEFEVVA